MARTGSQSPTFGLASLMVAIAFVAILLFVTTPLVRSLGDQDLSNRDLAPFALQLGVFLGLLGAMIGGLLGLFSRLRLILFPGGMILGGIVGGGAAFLLLTPIGLSVLVGLFVALTALFWLGVGTAHIQGGRQKLQSRTPPLVPCLRDLEQAADRAADRPEEK